MVRTKKAIKLSGMRDQLDNPLDEAAPANQSADYATSGTSSLPRTHLATFHYGALDPLGLR
ncbi:hypothetical protein ABIA00_003260 [Bradyrhizobium ottawaense]|uniref:hypothetical protein n=1 Tax=Bradyrhizobium ottawaense TaxID=931866 RepID=UPI00383239AB